MICGGPAGSLYGTTATTTYDRTLIISLKNLLRSVCVIDTLRGKISVTVPTEVTTLQFDDLEASTVQIAGILQVALRGVEGQPPNVNVDFEF